MSKTSQAANIVPEPQGAKNVQDSINMLTKARNGVNTALQGVVTAIMATGLEGLSQMHDHELGILLMEVARARNTEAITMVAMSMKWTANIHLGADEAEAMLSIGYNKPAENFFVDGHATKLADLLIVAIRRVPKADGVDDALRRLIRAKVPTDLFLDIAFKSGMKLEDKMAALGLATEKAQISDESVEALISHLLRSLEIGYETVKEALPKILAFVDSRDRSGHGEEQLILKLVSHQECVYASTVARIVPKAFDAACSTVLASGSPVALASFWRTHSAQCDRKAFQDKLTEALRPDPEALAKAILDDKKYGHDHFPMAYMMHPHMMFMHRGMW